MYCPPRPVVSTVMLLAPSLGPQILPFGIVQCHVQGSNPQPRHSTLARSVISVPATTLPVGPSIATERSSALHVGGRGLGYPGQRRYSSLFAGLYITKSTVSCSPPSQ